MKLKPFLPPLAALLLITTPVSADTPLAWINASNPSAYTTTKGELEINAAALAINDTLDVFNYREDLIAANSRLEGDSGDLSGSKLELNYGITEDLSIFYSRQQQALTLDLGEFSSIDVVKIDDALDTARNSAGIKWTFFRANLLNSDNRQSAASLELTGFSSESDSFDVTVKEIRLDNLAILFGTPQTFSVNNMKDEGWKAKLIYSWPFAEFATGSVWSGYGKSSATSGTDTDIKSVSISRIFKQDFEIDESYFYVGASLSAQISPRLSASVSYEHIAVNDSELARTPLNPPSTLPSFFTSSGKPAVDNNHTLRANVAYWLSPNINLSLSGQLYSNQFTGVLPHYNNPLSDSFSDTPYGYAGVELSYRIRNIP